MKNRKGFTIVELVIVIAVIAILAAVLIPTFSTVTANARASAAQQQAKSALDAILANTSGSIPEGTLFAIDNNAKYAGGNVTEGGAEYWFAFEGQALTQIDLNKDGYPKKYSSSETASNYAVYVSADCIDATKGAEALAKCAALIGDVLSTDGNPVTVTLATSTTEGITATATGLPEGTTISVYYSGDIKPSCVVFVGSY